MSYENPSKVTHHVTQDTTGPLALDAAILAAKRDVIRCTDRLCLAIDKLNALEAQLLQRPCWTLPEVL